MSKHKRGNDTTMSKDIAPTPAISTSPMLGEQALHVPLSDIHVDYTWNCRSERRIQDLSDNESGGFEGFGAGIRANGQISPVILRNTGGKTLSGAKTDKKYELVVGFRRMRAITLLNTEGEIKRAKTENKPSVVPGLPNGHISAIVREINDQVSARILNGTENTGRTNLKAPDMMFLAKQLNEGGKLTQVAIGEALGINQSWVSRLLKVGTLPPAILANWRDGTPIPSVTTKDGIFKLDADAVKSQKELTEPEMRQLAELKCGPEEITARYIRMVTPQPKQGDGPGTGKPEEDKTLEEIKAIGTLAGCMVRAGVLENGSLDWARLIGPRKKDYPIDCGKNDSRERLIQLCDAIQDAFEAEVTKGAQGRIENVD